MLENNCIILMHKNTNLVLCLERGSPVQSSWRGSQPERKHN